MIPLFALKKLRRHVEVRTDPLDVLQVFKNLHEFDNLDGAFSVEFDEGARDFLNFCGL